MYPNNLSHTPFSTWLKKQGFVRLLLVLCAALLGTIAQTSAQQLVQASKPTLVASAPTSKVVKPAVVKSSVVAAPVRPRVVTAKPTKVVIGRKPGVVINAQSVVASKPAKVVATKPVAPGKTLVKPNKAVAQPKTIVKKELFPFDVPGALPGTSPLHFVSFIKEGRQNNCEIASYQVRFQVDFPQGSLNDPGFRKILTETQFIFTDKLPAGLKISRARLKGDIKNLPDIVKTAADTDNVVSMTNIAFDPAYFSATKDSLYFTVEIEARIQPALFNTPSERINNQAVIDLTNANGVYSEVQSHDKTQPQDADAFKGTPTAALVDLSACPKPDADEKAADDLNAILGIASPSGGGDSVSGTSVVNTILGGGSTIVLDATNPPPFGGTPCFEVNQGRLDCSPNGNGKYIYSLTLGPAASGQTIEVVPLNSGVSVTPAVQVVPAGGGTLQWEFSGASPGMTLSFDVIGGTTYDGPEKGWGECCVETLFVDIPLDPCPDPKPPVPDLEVKKTPLDGQCDTNTGLCTFRIEITNRGDAPFTGVVPIRDAMLQGTPTLAQQPAAPWRCANQGSGLVCAAPGLNIPPKGTIFLDLQMSLPISQWQGNVNCASIDFSLIPNVDPAWAAAKSVDCAIVPPPPPTTTDDPGEVEVEKKATECAYDFSSCKFEIVFTNKGPKTYKGQLAFNDTMNGKVPFTGFTHNPAADYSCNGSNPSLQCVSNGDVTLPPGATQTVTLDLQFDPSAIRSYRRDLGLGNVTGPLIENCATATSAGRQGNVSCDYVPGPGPGPGPGPDPDPKKPSLVIQKVLDNCATGNGGAGCIFSFKVTNIGDAPYDGPVVFTDTQTAGVPVKRIRMVDGTCTGQPPMVECRTDANVRLDPLTSTAFSTAAIFDKPAYDQFMRDRGAGIDTGPLIANCASVSTGPGSQPSPQSCAVAEGPDPEEPELPDSEEPCGGDDPFDCEVEKQKSNTPQKPEDCAVDRKKEFAGCTPDSLACSFNIIFTNVSNVACSKPLRAIDRQKGGVPYDSFNSPPGVNCDRIDAKTLDCSMPPQNLQPNQSAGFQIQVKYNRQALDDFKRAIDEGRETGPLMVNCVDTPPGAGRNRTRKGESTESCVEAPAPKPSPKPKPEPEPAPAPAPDCPIGSFPNEAGDCACVGSLVMNADGTACEQPAPDCPIGSFPNEAGDCACVGSLVMNADGTACEQPVPDCPIGSFPNEAGDCACVGSLVMNADGTACEQPAPDCPIGSFPNEAGDCACVGSLVMNADGTACEQPAPDCPIGSFPNEAGDCACVGSLVMNADGTACEQPAPDCPIGSFPNEAGDCACVGSLVMNADGTACEQPAPDCPIGSFPNEAGDCACVGSLVMNADGTACEQPAPDCPIGSFPNAAGQCECVAGTQLDAAGTACVAVAPTCPIGSQPNAAGQCECVAGTQPNADGTGCEAIAQACPIGSAPNAAGACECVPGTTPNADGTACVPAAGGVAAPTTPDRCDAFMKGAITLANGRCGCAEGNSFDQETKSCVSNQALQQPCPAGYIGDFMPNCRVAPAIKKKPQPKKATKRKSSSSASSGGGSNKKTTKRKTTKKKKSSSSSSGGSKKKTKKKKKTRAKKKSSSSSSSGQGEAIMREILRGLGGGGGCNDPDFC